MQQLEDQVLLTRVADGDEAALRDLYDRHASWLRLRLARRTSDPDLVLEVLSDTFVVVWRQAHRFRGEGEVAAWLWGIAIRRLLSRLRGHREPAPVRAEVISAASPVVASAEDEVLLGVTHSDVGAALRNLSPELQTVVQTMVIDGLTSREAAQLLGLPQGTVKSRIRAARLQLREQLTAQNRSLS